MNAGCTPRRKQQKERRKPVLILQHAPHEHPAAVRRALESQGIQTLCLHPYLGDAYPRPQDIAGVISLGGPMSANNELEHPWIRDEVALLGRCAELMLPVVGICLGGQMLARALGGRVEKNARAEVGWFPIRLNEEGLEDPILGGAGAEPVVYHWHEDTFHPPDEAVPLAYSSECPRQAFRIGERAYGFQFHPEADHQLVNEWMSLRGVDDDIAAVRQVHGEETVQDSATQRSNAFQYEEASLRITAGIGRLFRRTGEGLISPDFTASLRRWCDQQDMLVVEFEGASRKPVQLRGRVVRLFEISGHAFVIFQEESMLLWPIRVDDLLKVHFP